MQITIKILKWVGKSFKIKVLNLKCMKLFWYVFREWKAVDIKNWLCISCNKNMIFRKEITVLVKHVLYGYLKHVECISTLFSNKTVDFVSSQWYVY